MTAAGLRPVKQAVSCADDEVVRASPVRVGERDTMHAMAEPAVAASTTPSPHSAATCRLVRTASRVALFACAASHGPVFSGALGQWLPTMSVHGRDDAPAGRVDGLGQLKKDLDEVSKVDDAMVCLLYYDAAASRHILHYDRLGDDRLVGKCLRELLRRAHRTNGGPLLSPVDDDALCCDDHVQACMERTHLHPTAAARAPPVEYNPCRPTMPAGAFHLLVRVHFDLSQRASMELEPFVHGTIFHLDADASKVADRPILQTLSYCRINPPQSDQLAAELHRLEQRRQAAWDQVAELKAAKQALEAERRGVDEVSGTSGFDDMFRASGSAPPSESQKRNIEHRLDDVNQFAQRVDSSVGQRASSFSATNGASRSRRRTRATACCSRDTRRARACRTSPTRTCVDTFRSSTTR